MRRRLIAFATILLAGPTVLAAGAQLGQKVGDFQLEDFRGEKHALADYQESKFIVLAFLGTECPLAKRYGPRLAALAEQYEPRGVTFLGIDANVQDSITEIAAYARVHKIDFPLLKDAANRLADEVSAERTPEVFVLDEQRTVRYRGRIDDQYGIGYVRDEPQHNDLQIALDELLAGKPVSTPITESIGCHIGRINQPQPDTLVTYSNQITRILQNRCVECHREGEIAPFALTDYDEVVGWAETIQEVVHEGRMPPWHASDEHGHFENSRRLTDEEKETVYAWVKAGAPEGDPTELPEPELG